MATVFSITTAEELFAARTSLGRCELVRGELIEMNPAGFEHGWTVQNIAGPLFQFVKANGLGVVVGAETGFYVHRNPDTVRAPDVGFIRVARIPKGGRKKFFDGPPDLAVEVLSPDDRSASVSAKVADWLQAGCESVWLVDPAARTVLLKNSDGYSRVFTAPEAVVDKVLPGFRLPVVEIFPRD